MKRVLSLLLCYVFLQAQTFALRGGPAGTSTNTVQGAYSGTLIENSGGTDIGLFLIAAVGNGASSGQIIFFSSSANESDTYLGTLTGLSDTSRGGSGTFTGIFNGSAATGNSAQRSISGQMVVNAVRTSIGGLTQRIQGTASARTVAVASGGSNAGVPGALKTFIATGWQTSTSTVGRGFALTGSN